MNPTTLPDNVLNAMSGDERKRLGKAGRTTAQIVEANTIKSEKELQRQCVGLLRTRDNPAVRFIHVSAMHKKTTARKGTPDLLFSYGGIPVAVECKLPNCKPTIEQEQTMQDMAIDRWRVFIVHSVEEMREALKTLEQ